MFLLDTVVVSELRTRPRLRNANLVNWIGSVPSSNLFVSVITLAEIERGIERQRGPNPAFAGELSAWLDVTLSAYESRILPLTAAISRHWGRLAHRIGNMSPDLAIAATALEHGLTVVTRNTSHFTPTGVVVFNPFEPDAAR